MFYTEFGISQNKVNVTWPFLNFDCNAFGFKKLCSRAELGFQKDTFFLFHFAIQKLKSLENHLFSVLKCHKGEGEGVKKVPKSVTYGL